MQFFVCILFLCGCVATAKAAVLVKSMKQEIVEKDKSGENDKGYFKNCGDPKNKFTLWWSPKLVSTHGFVTVSLNFTSNFAWSEGIGNISLKIGSTPVHTLSRKINCSTFALISPSSCPIKKGEHVVAKYTGAAQMLPKMTYHLRIELLDVKKVLLICAEGTIQTKAAADDEVNFL